MKKLLNTTKAFLFIGFVCLGLVSCKKSETPYYDYVNTQQTFNGSALDYLKAQPKGTFDSLLLVLNRYPLLMDSLTKAKVTVFAPVNKNFEAAIKFLNITRKGENKAPVYLSNADESELLFMVSKYIIRGNRTSDYYVRDVDGVLVQSILTNYPMHIKYSQADASGFVGGGPTVLNFSDPFGSIFTTKWVTTTTNAVNIKTNNAVINILTPIHIFGFDEFTIRLNN